MSELKLKDLRKHPRKAYGAVANLTIDHTTYSCVIMDISKGGAFVSLALASQISEGRLVELEIPFHHKNKVIKKMAKVTRSSEQGLALKFMENQSDFYSQYSQG
jgi:hypothetical protein